MSFFNIYTCVDVLVCHYYTTIGYNEQICVLFPNRAYHTLVLNWLYNQHVGPIRSLRSGQDRAYIMYYIYR